MNSRAYHCVTKCVCMCVCDFSPNCKGVLFWHLVSSEAMLYRNVSVGLLQMGGMCLVNLFFRHSFKMHSFPVLFCFVLFF